MDENNNNSNTSKQWSSITSIPDFTIEIFQQVLHSLVIPALNEEFPHKSPLEISSIQQICNAENITGDHFVHMGIFKFIELLKPLGINGRRAMKLNKYITEVLHKIIAENKERFPEQCDQKNASNYIEPLSMQQQWGSLWMHSYSDLNAETFVNLVIPCVFQRINAGRNCPGYHGFKLYSGSTFRCNLCNTLPKSQTLYGCRRCQYSVCFGCKAEIIFDPTLYTYSYANTKDVFFKKDFQIEIQEFQLAMYEAQMDGTLFHAIKEELFVELLNHSQTEIASIVFEEITGFLNQKINVANCNNNECWTSLLFQSLTDINNDVFMNLVIPSVIKSLKYNFIIHAIQSVMKDMKMDGTLFANTKEAKFAEFLKPFNIQAEVASLVYREINSFLEQLLKMEVDALQLVFLEMYEIDEEYNIIHNLEQKCKRKIHFSDNYCLRGKIDLEAKLVLYEKCEKRVQFSYLYFSILSINAQKILNAIPFFITNLKLDFGGEKERVKQIIIYCLTDICLKLPEIADMMEVICDWKNCGSKEYFITEMRHFLGIETKKELFVKVIAIAIESWNLLENENSNQEIGVEEIVEKFISGNVGFTELLHMTDEQLSVFFCPQYPPLALFPILREFSEYALCLYYNENLTSQFSTENHLNSNHKTVDSESDFDDDQKSNMNTEIFDEQTLHAISRLGAELFLYHTHGMNNKPNVEQLLEDFLFIHDQQIQQQKTNNNNNGCQDLYEFVDEYLREQWFNGENECFLKTCKYIAINSRDRMSEDGKYKNLTTVDIIYCNIHCSLLHAYDSGYRLKSSEYLNMLESMNFDDIEIGKFQNNSQQDIMLEADNEMLTMKKVVGQRRGVYESMRVHSKFSNDLEDNESKNNNNGKNNNQKKKNATSSLMKYSFGKKFRYWNAYKNDKWFIIQKYASFKEELLHNLIKNICKNAWNEEIRKAMVYMKTKFCRTLYAREIYNNYDIIEYTLISISHLLSLTMYTNFTALCSEFSRVFRSIDSSESDESLKERNSNYREWSRLLVETIHLWGTTLEESDIETFYHGISVMMTFTSTLAVFFTPTSMTNCLSVAINFASNGVVIELKNTKKDSVTYFDCMFSDFSNESEQLFVNGGFDDRLTLPKHNGLIIFSIRSLKFKLNFELYGNAIYAFRIINDGVNARYNKIKFKRKDAMHLEQLISAQLLSSELNSKSKMNYSLQLFNNYVRSLVKISIDICVLNMPGKYYFLHFRHVFCELYSDEEMISVLNIHQHGFSNRIKTLKIKMLLNLCPNVGSLEIFRIRITDYIMKQLLDLVAEIEMGNGNTNIKRIFVGQYKNKVNVLQMYENYVGRFASVKWKLNFVRTGINATYHSLCPIGLELQKEMPF